MPQQAPPLRLLVVDDEPSLLGLLQRYLERLGYKIDVAATPAAALKHFESDPEKYACILTDLKLPGMSGEEMLERMRANYPALRAIVSSGYPYVPRSKKILFLQKPFVPKMLVESIEALLGSP